MIDHENGNKSISFGLGATKNSGENSIKEIKDREQMENLKIFQIYFRVFQIMFLIKKF